MLQKPSSMLCYYVWKMTKLVRARQRKPWATWEMLQKPSSMLCYYVLEDDDNLVCRQAAGICLGKLGKCFRMPVISALRARSGKWGYDACLEQHLSWASWEMLQKAVINALLLGLEDEDNSVRS
jgi:hypothetical protein